MDGACSTNRLNENLILNLFGKRFSRDLGIDERTILN